MTDTARGEELELLAELFERNPPKGVLPRWGEVTLPRRDRAPRRSTAGARNGSRRSSDR